MLARFQRVWTVTLLCCFCAWGQDYASVESAISEAMNLASSGDLSGAEAALLRLEKTHSANPEVLYRLGLILLRQKKVEAAGKRLEAAAELYPRSPLIWLGAAQTRLQLGRRREAIEAAEKALSLAPQEPPVARALAMFYAQAGEFAKAADQELRWSEASPQDKQSLPRAAELYLQAGDAPKAIELGQKILAQGDSAAIRNLLGRSYRLGNDPARAVEEFQRAVRIDPNHPAYYVDLAQLFIDHRTPQPAVLVLEEAVRRLPAEVELLRLLGLAYYGTGDSRRALEAFLKLTEAVPDSEVGYASLETLLPEAGTYLPEILKRLEGFSARNPSIPVGYYLRAKAVEAAAPERKGDLRALYEKAIDVGAGFWPAYFELHKILLEDGDLEAAARALEKTVELNPAYAPAHYSLAQIYARLGDRERARKQREVHHALATRQREEAEQRRRETPRLPYKIGER